MTTIDHEHQPLEEWRPGVMTRMQVSALNGAAELCVFEQFCAPGKGAPTHRHDVEEVLTVLAGLAEVWLGEAHLTLAAGQSLIVPKGISHGFRNAGAETLHVQAILAAPIFEAAFDDRREVSRRWVPPGDASGAITHP